MIASLIFFITSLLIVGAAVKSFSSLTKRDGVLLLTASALYSTFCLMAFIKTIGVTPEQITAQIIGGPENMAVAKVGLDTMIWQGMTLAFCGGTLFNVVTSIWIWLRGGLWKWCLTMVAAFCVVGVCAGLLMGVSPIQSLFALCCAFMAAVGLVLGLCYVDICVIGNIWLLSHCSSARAYSLSAHRGVA